MTTDATTPPGKEEKAPAAASAPAAPKVPPGQLVSVLTDENGDGTGMFGQDADKVLSVHLVDGGGKVRFGESHAVGITRIDVSGTTPDATVAVAVVLK